MEINQITKMFIKLDFYVLKAIYTMRCLSIEQIHRYFYIKIGLDYKTCIERRVNPLHELGIVKKQFSNTGVPVLFLTEKGIEIVRSYFKLPNDFHDSNNDKVVNNRRTEGILDMNSRLIDHQLSLNEFVLDFKKQFATLRNGEKIEYYDEKFVSQYETIRPDGMISYRNLDLFLEIDMGSETRRQLNEKWNRYRSFLDHCSSMLHNRKIVVLFIVNSDKIEQRKNLIRSTADSVFTSLLNDNFDVYIGTHNEIINACFKKIIPLEAGQYVAGNILLKNLVSRKHGFSIVKGNKLKMKLDGASYGYYIRKLQPNGGIKVVNGTVQEFLLDEYVYAPLSVIGKISLAERTSSSFKIANKRDINYVVIVSSVKMLYDHLKCLNLFDTPTVFYTTPKLLNEKPFCKALFKLDKDGNIFYTTDETYKKLTVSDA